MMLRTAGLLALASVLAAGEAGADLGAAFARARAGGSLRLAAIGGSITQGGECWIGPWLRTRLPGLAIALRNAGMSATGSELGCFRLERDVIAADPDLVLVETAVNDGGLPDDEAVRCCESVVRRLAALPRRPGILMVLAAARGGANHRRHRAVAEHYGLRCADMQAAVAEKVAAGARWEDFFTDDVHLNPKGNELYAATIAAALEPSVDAAAGAVPPLPPPLSKLPLWLDGRMWTPGPAPGWKAEPQVGDWWDCFFTGILAAREPGAVLELPAAGTTLGVMFALNTANGTALASVDGAFPVEIPCHLRGGYEPTVLARDLPPGEHRITLAMASWNARPLRLGYVLAAGPAGGARAAAGPWTAERLSALRMEPVPAAAFRIAGPVGVYQDAAADPAAALAAPPLPLEAAAYRAATVPGPDGPVPVRGATGAAHDLLFASAPPWRGTAVACARFRSDRAAELLVGVAVDYYASLRCNGREVATIATGHGSPRLHRFVPVAVQPGWNDLVLTVLPGSRGFRADLLLERTAGIAIEWEQNP